jgi:hypothetical protein
VIDPELAASFDMWCKEEGWPIGETLEGMIESWITKRVRSLLPYMPGVRTHSPNVAFLADRWIEGHPGEFAEDKKAAKRFLSGVGAAYKRGLESGEKPNAAWIHGFLGFSSVFEIERALNELQAEGHLDRIAKEVAASRETAPCKLLGGDFAGD